MAINEKVWHPNPNPNPNPNSSPSPNPNPNPNPNQVWHLDEPDAERPLIGLEDPVEVAQRPPPSPPLHSRISPCARFHGSPPSPRTLVRRIRPYVPRLPLTRTQVTHNLGRVLTNRTLGIVRSEIQQAWISLYLSVPRCISLYLTVSRIAQRDTAGLRPLEYSLALLPCTPWLCARALSRIRPCTPATTALHQPL